MNEINQANSDCSEFESAISAMIDGELSAVEKNKLGDHLLRCEDCRQTVRDFEAATQTLQSAYTYGSMATTLAKPAPRRRFNGYVVGTATAIAAACIMLVLLWKPAPDTQPKLMTAQQVMRPFKELYQLSILQERDQTLKIKTMQLELRQLQLEIGQVEEGSLRDALTEKLEAMIARIQDQATLASTQ